MAKLPSDVNCIWPICPGADPPATPFCSTCQRPLLLKHRYRLIDYLAKGGMGETILGEDIKQNERVVIKFNWDERLRDRFEREADIGRRTRHSPMLVHTIDRSGPMDRFDFVVLNFVPGKTLSEILEQTRTKPLPFDTKVALALQFTRAVAEAHALSILHRDLKPDNVVVEFYGDHKVQVTIIDFGLARHMDAAVLTDVESFVGTPQYVAPEMINSQPESYPATDVYSAAVVLFQIFQDGCPPYDVAFMEDDEVSRRRQNERLREVKRALTNYRTLTSEKSEECQAESKFISQLGKLLKRCFDWDPLQRPYSGLALHEEMTQIAVLYRDTQLAHRIETEFTGFEVLENTFELLGIATEYAETHDAYRRKVSTLVKGVQHAKQLGVELETTKDELQVVRGQRDKLQQQLEAAADADRLAQQLNNLLELIQQPDIFYYVKDRACEIVSGGEDYLISALEGLKNSALPNMAELTDGVQSHSTNAVNHACGAHFSSLMKIVLGSPRPVEQKRRLVAIWPGGDHLVVQLEYHRHRERRLRLSLIPTERPT